MSQPYDEQHTSYSQAQPYDSQYYDETAQYYDPSYNDPSYDPTYAENGGYYAPPLEPDVTQSYAQMSLQQPSYDSNEYQDVIPVDPKCFQVSTSTFPSSPKLAKQCGIPLVAHLQSLAPTPSPLPLVNFIDTGVIRCRACRAYINAYVPFLDNGKRWKCNVCHVPNDVPSNYYSPLDQYQKRTDLDSRPELLNASYEIMAPSEYMIRPPQPPVFIFVIDVSSRSHQNSSLEHITTSIESLLDSLPGGVRTQIAFVTFASQVHVYNLNSSLDRPQMIVLSDLDRMFRPISEDLLVPLVSSRPLISDFLRNLSLLHQPSSSDIETAFGPALQAAFLIGSSLGGRIVLFTSSLPSLGPGRLQNRSNPRTTGSEKEHEYLSSASSFYSAWAQRCNKMQLSVDLFLFSHQYNDLASLSKLTKLTNGSLFYYPNYGESKPFQEAFPQDLLISCTSEHAWEAVVRVRCSKGFKITKYYGDFHLRGSDLLSLPVSTSDKTITIEFEREESTASPSQHCIIQAALLYTSSTGERRIRIHTIQLAVSEEIDRMFSSIQCNGKAIVAYYAKKACALVEEKGFQSAREYLQTSCTALLRNYRACYGEYVRLDTEEEYPDIFWPFPCLIVGLLKHQAFRKTTQVDIDRRCYVLRSMEAMNWDQLMRFVYPKMYVIAPLDQGVGESDSSTGEVYLPVECGLTAQEITSEYCYLIDNGCDFYLRIGQHVPSWIVEELVGVDSIQGLKSNQLELRIPRDDEVSSLCYKVYNILDTLRQENLRYQPVHIVVEGDQEMDYQFQQWLVWDRTEAVMSKDEFIKYLANNTR